MKGFSLYSNIYLSSLLAIDGLCLAVILDEIFHELWVTKVDGACVVLVQLGNLCHVLVSQREVEEVVVLRHALLVARLGNGYDATLGEPA